MYKKSFHKGETRDSDFKLPLISTPKFIANLVNYIAISKTELFTFITDKLAPNCWDIHLTVLAIRNIVSNHKIQKQNLQPCWEEEVVNHMSFHVIELSKLGMKNYSGFAWYNHGGYFYMVVVLLLIFTLLLSSQLSMRYHLTSMLQH